MERAGVSVIRVGELVRRKWQPTEDTNLRAFRKELAWSSA